MSGTKWRKRSTAGSTWRKAKSHLLARVSGDDVDDSNELQLSAGCPHDDTGRDRVFLRWNTPDTDSIN